VQPLELGEVVRGGVGHRSDAGGLDRAAQVVEALAARFAQLGLGERPGQLRQLAAAEVLVERDGVALEQLGVGALDVPGDVLGEVLARFGDEEAEPPQRVVAHPVPVRYRPLGRQPRERRVLVDAGVLELEVESHVVDAGGEVVELVRGHAEVAGQLRRGALHAVAQADGGDRRGGVERPGDDRHRVDVVEVQRVGAEPLHVADHLEHGGDGAQAAHDAADAEGVADRLLEAVAFGDLEVADRARPVARHLDHAQHVVGAVERALAVGGGGDRGSCPDGLGDPPGDDVGEVEPRGVDVEQPDVALGQGGGAEDVAEQVLGEDGAAGADEGDGGVGHRGS